jgi:hypothetical protein
MTDKPDDPIDASEPPDERSEERLRDAPGGSVTVDGIEYQISPTAFRSHYQVMTGDGKLLGLIEALDAPSGRTFTARPATGAGMTQSLMIKIADLASASGLIR